MVTKQKNANVNNTTHVKKKNVIIKTRRGEGAQWVARLTRNRWMHVSREFNPLHQRLPLFP